MANGSLCISMVYHLQVSFTSGGIILIITDIYIQVMVNNYIHCLFQLTDQSWNDY